VTAPRPLLQSPSSQARADEASAIAEAGTLGSLDDLRALLADDAPFVFQRAGQGYVSEVRFRVLEALQGLYRQAGRAPDFGPVQVRKAMPAGEAIVAAQAALKSAGPARGEDAATRAARFVQERVRPAPDEREAAFAYRVLQELGQVAYRTEEVDPATYQSPLQREVAASQVSAERPRPHLRVSSGDGGRVLGYCYREEAGARWSLDFADDPEAAEAAYVVERFLTADPAGVPRVLHEGGQPRRNPDGSLVLEGTVPLDTAQPVELLRSLQPFVQDPYQAEVVE
jgi:hypothetical protein